MTTKFCKRCTMRFEVRAGMPEGNYEVGEDAAVVTRCRTPGCGLRFWHWVSSRWTCEGFTPEEKVKTAISSEDTNHHNLRPWSIVGSLTSYEEEQ